MKHSEKIILITIISFATIISAIIIGNAYSTRGKITNKIEVTGKAERNFTADLIVWNGSFSKQKKEMKEAFKQLKADEIMVKEYLLKKGIKEEEVVFSSVQIQKVYDDFYNDKGSYNRIFAGYKLSQDVSISSQDIDKIEKISREVSELIDMGVELTSDAPDFFYTKLSDLKLELVEDATTDGRTRAEKIANSAKARLGKLLYANLGIFQITGQNSNENYSWGGALNTKSKEKTASITVRLNFETK
ncbi:MAG: SIMPL domain-containing protein [Candidatus Symbiothrix sp.]|jgi:hypothetical protein|nr:SIMPL domain-containing protein [Candidatus Symbiothrix sp.]